MWLRKSRVYADAAAATPLSVPARKELIRLLALYGNPGGLHREAVAAKEELERARASVATSIGAHADEIVFTSSGTEANNLALQGLLRPLLRERGEAHAATSAVEHPSVLEPLHALEPEGLYITELSVNEEGLISPADAAEALNEQTVLVSVQLVNSEVGAVQPIREVAKVLRKQDKKILLHVDASQAPLWVDINVEKLHADLITLDAQKICGPKGVGCLYVRRGTLLEPVLWGGGQEGGVRSGTENVAAIGAFAAALHEAQAGVEKCAQKVATVRDYLWEEIKRLLPDAIMHGPRGGGARAANNLSVSIPGLDGQMAVIAMDALGIAASTRSACSTGEEEPSRVLTAMGVTRAHALEAVRITLPPSVTRAHARRIASALAGAAARYRSG